MISIILKPFMGLVTAIKNNRFFAAPNILWRLIKKQRTRNKLEFDATTPPDQMSGLSIRILAVNIIAIMILGLGILYLGQYTDSLIEGELAGLKSEAQLFSGAIAEGAVRPVFQISSSPFENPQQIDAIKPELARRMVRRLSEIGKSRIRLYAIDGSVMSDSHQLSGGGASMSVDIEMENIIPPPEQVTFDSLFTQSASRFLDLIPMKTQLMPFPESLIGNIYTFPDTQAALIGNVSASAWKNKNNHIILTVGAPVLKGNQVLGVVFLAKDGAELEKSIAEVRVDVFRVFLGALGITVMLSIYLSGLVSRPLQKLAFAAEAVRQGKGRYVEIPDMSHRNDEIGDLSVALRDMTYALLTRMDTIERFAADVSHEIKNPLTSVRSAVETALKINDEEKRKKLLDIILHDVQRLDRLISDISSASRLDAELSREEMGRVDILDMMHRLKDAYKKPLKRLGQEDNDDDTKIVLDIPEDAAFFAKGNTERLEQVFGNLISNALSFSPSHGRVTIRTTQQNDKIMIAVDDEGPGIPENKLQTVFDRFYSERPEHEGYGQHSGLGLSISKQIIDAHQGQIWAENLRNDKGDVIGARFNVVLMSAA